MRFFCCCSTSSIIGFIAVVIFITMSACNTRSKTEHSIFGQPSELPKKQLPTSEDVFRAYDYCLKDEQCTGGIHQIATKIAEDVIQVYADACIPTVQLSCVIVKVKRLVEKVHKLGKYSENKKTSQTFKGTLYSFKTLFDICSCKCYDSGVRDRSFCSCPLPQKIPAIEWKFWLDQKRERKMYMGSIDKVTTSKLKKKEKRQYECCIEKKTKNEWV